MLCSHLSVGEGIEPFEPSEWTKLAQILFQSKKQPKDIYNLSETQLSDILRSSSFEIDRIKRLIDRSASLTFEIEKLNNMGIYIVTRADEKYPKLLKDKIGNLRPPLFYYAGDIELLNDDFIGIVGSRDVSDEDMEFTKKSVSNAIKQQFSIVSGGAKGVDTVSTEYAIEKGAAVVEFLSDSMSRKLKASKSIHAIRDGRLLILSATKPDAGFNVGFAMQRNKYIYAQAMGTVVVKSDYNKGGTWAGALENLKHKWSHLYCRKNTNIKEIIL